MNMEIFRLINNLAHKSNVLDKIMILFSKYVPLIFMAVLALVFISGIINKNLDYRKAAISTFTITIINLLLNFLVGSVFFVDRPFVHNKVNLLYPHVNDASFPSDHATGTMSIALGLKKYNKIFSTILTILSIIVGFSRIYVGHHYPLDIIGAYSIVYITAYIYNASIRTKIENIYETAEKKIMEQLGFKESFNEI